MNENLRLVREAIINNIEKAETPLGMERALVSHLAFLTMAKGTDDEKLSQLVPFTNQKVVEFSMRASALDAGDPKKATELQFCIDAISAHLVIGKLVESMMTSTGVSE